ncbi:MAG: B12-binding domain-containing radical SAM protein [Nitrospirae bacterium]|nr:B12-binding domain-containing radical SAM protein [Nitrospirota bacterium]
MKIAIVNPSLRPESKRRQLPVGLAYVLTAVKKAGFDFDFIDMDINNITMAQLEEILSKTTYDVCALGCIVTGFKYAIQIADIAKKLNPKTVIIAGNSLVTSCPELLLNNAQFDIGVMSEGDVTIVELLQALQDKTSLSGVAGIVYKENGRVVSTPERPAIANLDEIGFPDWDIFDLEKYKEYSYINVNVMGDGMNAENILSYPLNSARGCPHRCSFCYHVFKGKKYRKYSKQAIMDEIKRLHFEYGCNFVSFWDELTFANIQSVRDMIDAFSKLDLKIGWECPTRGDLFKKEHLGLIKDLKAVGCDNIAFSLENASEEILTAMNKKLNVAQFIEQAQVLWEGGCVPITSVVFGYPQETPESIKKTIDVCEECNIFPSVGFLLPLPATPIYEWAKEHGHITDELAYLKRIGDRQDFHINLTTMSDEQYVGTVTSCLEALAKKMGLEFDSVFKTARYVKPKIMSSSGNS